MEEWKNGKMKECGWCES